MFQSANVGIALVLYCLHANSAEILGSGCSRSQWLVTKEDLQKWFDPCHLSRVYGLWFMVYGFMV